jgi:hypothetical protein
MAGVHLKMSVRATGYVRAAVIAALIVGALAIYKAGYFGGSSKSEIGVTSKADAALGDGQNAPAKNSDSVDLTDTQLPSVKERGGRQHRFQ